MFHGVSFAVGTVGIDDDGQGRTVPAVLIILLLQISNSDSDFILHLAHS